MNRLFKRHLYILSQPPYVKIGVASNVEKRISELQTGNPRTLFLYAVFEGMSSFERMCHRRLINDRVNLLGSQNEWFEVSEAFFSLVKDLIKIAEERGYKYSFDNRFSPERFK